MTNLEKKLDALIDALGFEVEATPTQESVDNRRRALAAGAWFDPGYEYDYKLTKKETEQEKHDRIHAEFEFSRRKSNLIVALACEFESGIISSEEYMDKIREINNENL